jgi:hypothetical protein
MTSLRLGLVLVGVFSLRSVAVQAAPILDFEGVSAPGNVTGTNVTPYLEDGFTLVSSGSPLVYHNDIFNNVPGTNGNGNVTSIFGWCGSCEVAPVLFTLTGPAVFSLTSIDFGGLGDLGDPGPISVLGHFSGGGTIMQVVDPAATFATFSFPGFNNLTAVEFGLLSGEDLDPALDNIVLEVAVPEPTSLLLLGTGGLALLAKMRRREQRTSGRAPLN